MATSLTRPYAIEPPTTTAALPGTDAGAVAPAWFAPAWTMLPLASRRCLVRNPLNGAAAELSSGEYAVLSACEGCRTLDEHQARAAQHLSAPAEHRPAIRELLERCARQGLLVSLPDLTARFGTASNMDPAPIGDISIPTADRPRLLARLLTGAARLQQRTGVAYRWHVFDDSRREESRRGNRDAIAACPDLQVTHHDLSLADSLQSRLEAALPGLEQEIGSLLAPAAPGEATFGRPMNYLLLWFAGRRFLSIDDDALVEPRRPPLARPGAQFGFAHETAFWYPSFDAAFSACPEIPLDPFAAHWRWLGLPMAEAWRRARREPGGLRIGDLPPSAGAYFDPGARVIATGNHVLGDPGWLSFSGRQLTVGAETRAWLAHNPEAARDTFESQIHWRGYASMRLAPQAGLSTTTLCGFDDSVLLPPAVRIGRETDTLIGEITRCIHPAAWAMSLPFALPHVRDARRRWLTSTEVLVFDRNRLFIDYARRRSASIHARDPAQRLVTLGAALVDLGTATDAALRGVIEEHAADHASRIAFNVNQQLDEAATPAAWKTILREWQGSPMLRLDSATLKQQTEPLDALRTLARDYGRALIAWPRLWAYCAEANR